MDFLNPDWRLVNLYRIVSKSSQKVVFRPNEVQRRINASKSKRKLVLKARQMGISTNEILKLWDQTIWARNQTSVIMAHEHDAIKKLFRIIARAHEAMPVDLRPRIDRGGGSKYEHFYPEIGSRIYCDLASRSDTIHRLHISEAAFCQPERLIATMQAVPLDGQIVMESTPNGPSNLFYDLWHTDDRYEKFFFPWYLQREYAIHGTGTGDMTTEEKALKDYAYKHYGVVLSYGQVAFRRQKISELKNLFTQEYPEDPQTCFLVSGRPAVSINDISRLRVYARQPTLSKDGLTLFMREHPGQVVIGADTSEGIGGDFSVAVVLTLAPRFEEVSILRGQWSTHTFAHKLLELGERFKTGDGRWPLLAVEANNHGHAVLQELQSHIRYPNLYKYKDDRVGWKTDSVTRPIMMNTLLDALANERLVINSEAGIRELVTLTLTSAGRIEAAAGKHDDCVVATAIALQMAIAKAKVLDAYKNAGSAIRL